MSQLPPAYLQDAALIAIASQKLEDAGGDSQIMVPAARNLAIRIRAFLVRWQDQPAIASEKSSLDSFRNMLLVSEREIESLHVATLAELLTFRKLSINFSDLIGHARKVADVMMRASPENRLKMLRQLKEDPCMADFDPETAVAEQTAIHAAKQKEYELLLDEYERDWPDRLDDPHYLAILDLILDQHDSLAEELHLMNSSFG